MKRLLALAAVPALFALACSSNRENGVSPAGIQPAERAPSTMTGSGTNGTSTTSPASNGAAFTGAQSDTAAKSGSTSPSTTGNNGANGTGNNNAGNNNNTGATATTGTTTTSPSDMNAPKAGEATAPSRPDADNTRVNARDKGGATLTPGDQGGSESDRKTTQQVRQAVMADSSLSFTAKNVKIITVNGRVTLRGAVKTDQERASIEAAAKKIAGDGQVDNQIEVKK